MYLSSNRAMIILQILVCNNKVHFLSYSPGIKQENRTTTYLEQFLDDFRGHQSLCPLLQCHHSVSEHLHFPGAQSSGYAHPYEAA